MTPTTPIGSYEKWPFLERVKAWLIRTFSSARILGPALAHQCSASTVGSSSIV